MTRCGLPLALNKKRLPGRAPTLVSVFLLTAKHFAPHLVIHVHMHMDIITSSLHVLETPAARKATTSGSSSCTAQYTLHIMPHGISVGWPD